MWKNKRSETYKEINKETKKESESERKRRGEERKEGRKEERKALSWITVQGFTVHCPSDLGSPGNGPHCIHSKDVERRP